MSGTERIFGLHTVRTVLQRNPQRVVQIWFQEGRDDQRLGALRETARNHSIASQSASRHELDSLTPGQRHQGVVAEVKVTRSGDDKELLHWLEKAQQPAFLLVLDGVQDPHNLGACLRSADAAGIHGVIIPKDRSAGITPVVRKVACGAAESVPIYTVVNLARTLRSLKDTGVWIYGAAQEATESLYDINLTGPVALVLGGEGKGLRRLTREHCDGLFSIPMEGTVESLNVSVATGITVFEAKRQRQ